MSLANKVTEREIRRGRVYQAFRSPLVWIPGLFGVVAAATAIVGGAAGWGLAGLAAGGIALGLSAFRWFGRRDQLTLAAVQRIWGQRERREHAKLLELRRKMRHDRDPSTTQLVRDLTSTLERLLPLLGSELESDRGSLRRDNLVSSVALYDSCQRLLRRSYELWAGASRMATAAAKERLLEQRGAVLKQVHQSIEHLNASLDQLQEAPLRDDGASAANVQLQDELRIGLETAQRVEERMEALEKELQVQTRLERN